MSLFFLREALISIGLMSLCVIKLRYTVIKQYSCMSYLVETFIIYFSISNVFGISKYTLNIRIIMIHASYLHFIGNPCIRLNSPLQTLMD
jgi:hypothetical protein